MKVNRRGKSLLALATAVSMILAGIPALGATEVHAAVTVFSGFTVNYCPTGTHGEETLAKLIDGQKNTQCVLDYTSEGTNSIYRGLYIEFHADKAFVPTSYIMTTADDAYASPDCRPKSWRLSGKLHGYATESWIPLDTVENAQMPAKNRTGKEFTIQGNSDYYQYFRLEIFSVENGPVLKLSEIELKEAVDSADLTYGSINGLPDGYVYDKGNEIPVSFTVKNHDGAVVGNAYYTTSFTRNGEPVNKVAEKGAYTLTATGKNGYKGRISRDFRVISEREPGLGSMGNPTVPQSVTDAWTGNYVYYGKYKAEWSRAPAPAPVRYRVLDKSATQYGGNTMLLDADLVLMSSVFNSNRQAANANVWKDSELYVKLNTGENSFLNTAFSPAEKAAIADSRVNGRTSNAGYSDYPQYVGLTGEKIFLLDLEDAVNTSYGYFSSFASAGKNHIKSNCTDAPWYWWLRSPNTSSDIGVVAGVGNNGARDNDTVDIQSGVSPAFNINLSSVIFSSLISPSSGAGAEYKLTILDEGLGVSVPGQVTKNAKNLVTIPYAVTDSSETADPTRVMAVVTTGTWSKENGWSDGTQMLQYEKLSAGSLSTSGTGTFTLDSSITGSWGVDYHVYVIAEDENDIYETDYAGAPVEIKPVTADATGYENPYDGQAHGIEVVVTAPASGATVKYGTAEGSCTMTSGPTITDVADSPKTVYYEASAPGFLTTAGSETITITKADLTVTAPTAKSGLEYTGFAQKLVDAGIADGGTVYYAVTTENTAPADESLYTKWIPAGTDVGTYHVWYMGKGDGNHKDLIPAGPKVDVSIGRGSWKHTAVSGSAKYGNAGTVDLSALIAQAASVSMGDVLPVNIQDNDTVLDGTPSIGTDKQLSFRFKNDENSKDKTATLTIPVTKAADYRDYNITVTLKATDKTVPTLTVDPIAVTYSGGAVLATKIVGTAMDGETSVPGAWTFKETEPAQGLTNVSDSGPKVVVFTPENTADYESAEAVLSLKIDPKSVTIKAKDRSITVGSAVPDLSSPVKGTDYTESGFIGTDTHTGAVDMAYSPAAVDNTKQGTYTITIDGEADQENYAVTWQSGTLTVRKKSSGGGGGGGTPVTVTCTVRFDMNGKTVADAPATQSVAQGGTAVRPAKDPEADGFTFAGWYREAACENLFDFSAPITSDTVIYAKWIDEKAETFTVTFDLNGKPGTAPAAQTVEKDGFAKEPAAPEAEGFTFTGWFTEAACGTKYDFSTPVTADLTLYAGWEAKTEPGPGPGPGPGPEPEPEPIVVDEADSWNLYEDASEHEFAIRGISVTDTVANSNAKSKVYYDAKITGSTITVKVTGDRKKAALVANALLEFDLGSAGVVEYALPVSYVKPVFKLSSTTATIRTGKETTLKTTVLAKSADGSFAPYDMTDVQVSGTGLGSVTKGEDGSIELRTSTAGSGKISIVKAAWDGATPANLAYTVKGSQKDVLSVDLQGLKTVVLNSNAKGQAFGFDVMCNGASVSSSDLLPIVDKKNTGLATISDDGKLVIAYKDGVRNGTYTVTLQSKESKEAKTNVRIRVNGKKLDKAITTRILRKYDVVTKQSMVVVPNLKDVGGRIETVSVAEEGFTAKLNAAGNIEIDYIGDTNDTESSKTSEKNGVESAGTDAANAANAADNASTEEKYNVKNLNIGNLTLSLTITGIDDPVTLPLKNVRAKKTTPTAKVGIVTIPAGVTPAEGQVIGTANIVSTYKVSSGVFRTIKPVKAEIIGTPKGVTAKPNENDPAEIDIYGISKKNASFRVKLTYAGGVTKTVTVRVKKK